LPFTPSRARSFVALVSLALVASAPAQVDPQLLKGLEWRNLGPFRGGRVCAVAGAVGQLGTYYIGLPRGGVWKTTSAGQTWYPVFDAIKETSCVGSVAVAPSDPNVIYAGTGEISGGGEGWGLYKSSDAGKTWDHLGLEATRMIPAILVDPHDPNLVLLAAEGNRQTQIDQRGVFRSTDGGKTWSHPLFVDRDTGVAHIAWAYDHPEVILATTQRAFFPPSSQTPPTSSAVKPPTPAIPAIYKSGDEGKTWTKLEGKGLPKLFGRFTVAIAQNTHAQRMYVIGMFGLYRSDDGGLNWRQMAAKDERIANGQGNYTSGVYVDPKNPDVVFTLATCVYRSTDGGNTFTGFKGAPGGDDPHFMWIDPADGNRMLLGGDQGATVTMDAGATWGSWYNQATAQVYHIATDNQYPYWVYATQQDSGVVSTRSRGNLGAITPMDWSPHPGFEFGFVIVDPLNPNITYAMSPALGIGKFTNPNGQWVEAGPAIDPSEQLRYGLAPIAFSPTDPKELMAGFQYLMSTRDGGMHWHKLSPDIALRKELPEPKKDGDFFARQAKYGNITSFSASSLDRGVIWVGTNNGLIHVTRDRGTTWTDVSIAKLSNASRRQIICIDASHRDAGTAYVVLTGDDKTSVNRTRDFGQTWTPIVSGLPTEAPFAAPVSVVRADTVRRGLLFAGTGTELFASFDDGDHWQSLMLNIPATQMMDLVVHGNDLVLGTYGRGLWVLDDISPLREMAPEMASANHLFRPGTAIRVRRNANGDTPFPPEIPHAKNPPLGAIIYYSLAKTPLGPISLEIFDTRGRLVRKMTSEAPAPYADPEPAVPLFWIGKRKPLPTEVGLNRVNWNLRYDNPPAFIHDVQDVINANPGETPEAIEGPIAMPGDYIAKLTVEGQSFSQPFRVENDPRSPARPRDLADQHEAHMTVVASIRSSWDAYQQVATTRQALTESLASTSKDVSAPAKAFDAKLEAIEGKIVYSRRFGLSGPSSNFVDLNIALLQILSVLDGGDAAPSEAVWAAIAASVVETRGLLKNWRELNGKPLADVNAVLAKAALKPVSAAPALPLPPAPAARYHTAKPPAVGVANGRIHIADPDGEGDPDHGG